MAQFSAADIELAARGLDTRSFLAYCFSLADEFEARRNRARHFVQHNLTSGTANESILRTFLAGISAGVLGVSDGFVCDPARGQSSRQCDILVYDRRFPLVYAEGGVTVVWPESVRMAIEVKTDLKDTAELARAVENIASAKRLHRSQNIYGLVFAFESLAAETALKALSDVQCEPEHRPAAVLLLKRGAIIQQPNVSDTLRYGGGTAPYQLRQCGGANPPGLVLAYLLMLYLRTQFRFANAATGETDLWAATEQLLLRDTSVVAESP